MEYVKESFIFWFIFRFNIVPFPISALSKSQSCSSESRERSSDMRILKVSPFFNALNSFGHFNLLPV